jgi:subtilisin family serine protease
VFFQSVSGLPITINDTFGHGSHCASLIAGRNKKIICGCAPNSSLYVAKICSQGSVRSFSILIDAINWAIEKQVDIISISYGGESNNDKLEAAIRSAVHDHNIIVIAAIGDTLINSTNAPCFPAMLSDCIAVGATDDNNAIDPITIINEKTEINAPGKNILGYYSTDKPQTMTGTSQAAAIVAGICGLIVSRHKSIGKHYSVDSIRDIILKNFDVTSDGKNQKVISPLKIFSKL